MGYADRVTLGIGPEDITIAGKGYLQPTTFSRSLLENEISRINQGAQNTIDTFQKYLNTPGYFQNTVDSDGRTGSALRSLYEDQIRQAEAKKLNINNLSEGQRVTLANNILQQQGLADQVHSARDDFVSSQKSGAFGNFLKAALPAAALAGGVAFAPALFGGGSAAATGVSAGGATAGVGGASGGLGSSILGTLTSKPVVYGALKGGGLTALTGGDFSDILKGAAIGGTLGGVGDYVSTGGNVTGLGSIGRGGSISAGGSPIPGVKPTGALGSISRTASNLGGGASSLIGGGSMQNSGLGNLFKSGLDLYGLGKEEDTLKKQQQLLMEAAGQQEALLRNAQDLYAPYQQAGLEANQQLAQALSQGFNPSDLADDPAYQFRLKQGEQALGRRLAGSGMSQSGAALKAAQEYGQGLASQQYRDSYNNWLAQNQQLAGLGSAGLNAAGSQANIYGALGNAAANRAGVGAQTLAAQDLINQRRRSGLYGLGSALLEGFF